MNSYGYGKSLGLRSKETESRYRKFPQKKTSSHARLKHLKKSLKNRPVSAELPYRPCAVNCAAILRLIEQHQLLGCNLKIAGTNALSAYEVRAGVFRKRGLLATKDMNVLWDIRPKLQLFAIDGRWGLGTGRFGPAAGMW